MDQLLGGTALVAAIAVCIAAALGTWLTPRAVREYWAALFIWCLQLFVSMAAVVWVGFLGMSTPHCSPNCEWDLLGNNFRGFIVAAALIQLASMALIVTLRHRRKVWVVPTAAVALVIALCVVSSVVAYKAMLFF